MDDAPSPEAAWRGDGGAAVPRLPAAAVEDNNWRDLDVPSPAALSQPPRITVVIPARDEIERLQLTLAALAGQRYPQDCLEVIVVDDGSDPPLTLPDHAPTARLLRQEAEGFGAGRARNLGAAHATGEVLLFLDADMAGEPELLRAHARWHSVVRDAVVVGPRWFPASDHAIAARLTPTALRQGRLPELVDPERATPQDWWQKHLERTDDLTARRADLFRAVISCNLSLRTETFHALGGFTPFGRRGIEDTELGWRAFDAGALLVPDRQARAWHLYPKSHLMSQDAKATRRRRLPLLWHHVPGHRARPRDAARRFLVPRIAVEIDAQDASFEEIVDSVEGVLASSVKDVAVELLLDDGEDGRLAREALEPDHRICLDDRTAAPVRVALPQPLHLLPDALARLCEPLESAKVGLVTAIVPVESRPDSPEVAVHAWRQRAARRAQQVWLDRHAGEPPSPSEHSDEAIGLRHVMDELFGALVEDGTALGLGPRTSAAAPARASSSELGSLAAAQREVDRLKRRLARTEQARRAAEEQRDRRAEALRAVQRRKVVRLADAGGRGLRRALRALRSARP